MENVLMVGAYLSSVAGSIFYILLGFEGMQAGGTNKYFPTWLIVALAGYAVFPVMNTVLVLGISLWLLTKRLKVS